MLTRPKVTRRALAPLLAAFPSALAAQATHAEPFDRDARRRHEARLDALVRAEPDDVVAMTLQYARGGQRREDVTTRAACHDECHSARHLRRFSRAILVTRPVACVCFH